MIDAHRLVTDADTLLRSLVECDIEQDGETITIKVNKQCSPWREYRLDTARAIYGALQDLQEAKREDKA